MPGRTTWSETAAVGPIGGIEKRSPSAMDRSAPRSQPCDRGVEIDNGRLAVAGARDASQGPGLQHALRQSHRVEEAGHPAEVIDARRENLAEYVDRDLAHRSDRDKHTGIEERHRYVMFEVATKIAESPSGGRDRRQIRNHDATLAIDPCPEGFRRLSVQSDDQFVADTQHVVVAQGADAHVARCRDQRAEDAVAKLRQRRAGAARIVILELRWRLPRLPNC